jgi:hypothetical protein
MLAITTKDSKGNFFFLITNTSLWNDHRSFSVDRWRKGDGLAI